MPFTWGQFHRKCSSYISLIRIWKLLIFKISATSLRGQWVKVLSFFRWGGCCPVNSATLSEPGGNLFWRTHFDGSGERELLLKLSKKHFVFEFHCSYFELELKNDLLLQKYTLQYKSTIERIHQWETTLLPWCPIENLFYIIASCYLFCLAHWHLIYSSFQIHLHQNNFKQANASLEQGLSLNFEVSTISLE